MRHQLVILGNEANWSRFGEKWGKLFVEGKGRPATPTRLIAELHYLQHIHALSDEQVVARWVENPYWQHPCSKLLPV